MQAEALSSQWDVCSDQRGAYSGPIESRNAAAHALKSATATTTAATAAAAATAARAAPAAQF